MGVATRGGVMGQLERAAESVYVYFWKERYTLCERIS